MASRRCKGTTLSGARCRRSTTNPGGWCGNCSALHNGPVAAADALYSLDDDGWYPSTLDGDDPLDLGWGLDATEDAASDPDGHTRGRVAMSASTPDYILDRLAGDTEPDVVAAVAANIATPAATLERLAANTTSAGVLMSVAGNVAAGPDALAAVAARDEQDFNGVWGHGEALEMVARHRNTRADTLAVLAYAADLDVRAAVAQNPATPADTLARLAGDPDPNVREAVAANPNTPAAARSHAALLAD